MPAACTLSRLLGAPCVLSHQPARECLHIPPTQASPALRTLPCRPAATTHASQLNSTPEIFPETGSWGGLAGPAESKAHVPLAVGPRSHKVLVRKRWFEKSPCHPPALPTLLLSWKGRREGRRSLFTPHVLPKAPESSSPAFPARSAQLWAVAEAIPGEPRANRGRAGGTVQGKACTGVRCGPPRRLCFLSPQGALLPQGAPSGAGQAGHGPVSASWCCVSSGGSLGLSARAPCCGAARAEASRGQAVRLSQTRELSGHSATSCSDLVPVTLSPSWEPAPFISLEATFLQSWLLATPRRGLHPPPRQAPSPWGTWGFRSRKDWPALSS